jgi:ribonuclease-3
MHPVERKTGYKFRNTLLLAEALTHSSLSHETRRHPFDNQRLEFLGDAVLQLVFTDELYARFPQAPEGELTKLRTRLVSRDALAVHARTLALGKHVLMGRGEESSGGRKRSSILADTFEALAGAIYLDGGLAAIRSFTLRLAEDALAECTVTSPEVNPKGQLQEILQALAPEAPSYEILRSAGPEHRKRFSARVIWCGTELGRGTGNSKKLAETSAAKHALGLQLWLNPANQETADNV